MSTLRKTIFSFLFPGGLVYLTALGFLRPHALPQWVQPPVAALPYIVLGFGLVFGWYLSSTRLILSLVVLALADRAVLLFPPTDPDPLGAGRAIFSATTFLLPLDLLALSLITEEAISSWRGLLRLPPVLIQPFLVLWLSLPDHADLVLSLQRPIVPTVVTARSVIPQPALMAFFVAALLLAVRFVLQQNPLDGGALWALTAAFTAFQGVGSGWSPTNFFSTARLILFLTLVQASHRRAYRDDLTGVSGKLAYEETVAALGQQYVVAVVGIDQLKQYIGQHGKPVGDQLLQLIAPKIVVAAGTGKVFRLAGEEFTILFPRKTTTDSLAALEAIRKAVEQSAFYLRGRDRVWEGSLASQTSGKTLAVTVSIGVAEPGQRRASVALVTKAAYRALYEAKGEGGNMVKRGAVPADALKSGRVEMGRILATSDFEH